MRYSRKTWLRKLRQTIAKHAGIAAPPWRARSRLTALSEAPRYLCSLRHAIMASIAGRRRAQGDAAPTLERRTWGQSGRRQAPALPTGCAASSDARREAMRIGGQPLHPIFCPAPEPDIAPGRGSSRCRGPTVITRSREAPAVEPSERASPAARQTSRSRARRERRLRRRGEYRDCGTLCWPHAFPTAPRPSGTHRSRRAVWRRSHARGDGARGDSPRAAREQLGARRSAGGRYPPGSQAHHASIADTEARHRSAQGVSRSTRRAIPCGVQAVAMRSDASFAILMFPGGRVEMVDQGRRREAEFVCCRSWWRAPRR